MVGDSLESKLVNVVLLAYAVLSSFSNVDHNCKVYSTVRWNPNDLKLGKKIPFTISFSESIFQKFFLFPTISYEFLAN
jgi:hypothetical protein